MPQTPHVEKHFTASETVRDIVIGMSDGLTVPFALAAGLSGAVEATGIIITAGLAEVAAGAIAMGLGGYLAARTDAEHFASQRVRRRQPPLTSSSAWRSRPGRSSGASPSRSPASPARAPDGPTGRMTTVATAFTRRSV
jgi:hypothetical protein